MVFKSEVQLKSFVLAKCKNAISKAENKIYKVIDEHLNRFYGEYNPVEYIRTKQLLHSLVRTGVKQVGNGYEAEVYFDVSKLNYPNPAMGQSGAYHSADLSSQQILDLAMQGSHGGWKDGTAIWNDSVFWIGGDLMKLLLDELKSQGIPIVK